MSGKRDPSFALLECPICLMRCLDPRMLPCVHTFCLSCLQQHLKATSSHGKFKCPACRHLCDVPLRGALDLPKNYYVNGLVDVMTRCGIEPDHVTSPTPSVTGKAFQFPICSKHQTDPAAHRCQQCGIPACPQCHREEFASHTFKDSRPSTPLPGIGASCTPTHVVSTKRNPHPAEIQIVMTDLLRRLETVKANLEYREECIEDEVWMMRKEIRAATLHLRRQLDAKESEMHSGLDGVEKNTLTRLRSTKHDVLQSIAKVESLRNYMENLKNRGYDGNSLPYASVLEEFRQLQEKPVERVEWQANVLRLPGDNGYLGQLTASETQSISKLTKGSGREADGVNEQVDSYTTVGESQLSVPGADSESSNPTTGGNEHRPSANVDSGKADDADNRGMATLPRLRLEQTYRLEAGEWVTGLARVHNFLCITHQERNYLWVYNLDGHMVKKVLIPDLKYPPGITVTDPLSGKIVIADNGANAIHWLVFDEDMCIKSQRVANVDYYPTEVVADLCGKVIISAKDPKQIIVYSDDGEELECIKLKEDEIGSLFMAVRSGDIFALLDAPNNRVIGVNKSGEIVLNYGHKKEDMAMLRPAYIMWHPDGFLLVADSNHHRIQVLSEDGVFGQHWLEEEDGVWDACCLHWDRSTRRLYVAQIPPPSHPNITRPVHSDEVKVMHVYSVCKPDEWSPQDMSTHITRFDVKLKLPEVRTNDLIPNFVGLSDWDSYE